MTALALVLGGGSALAAPPVPSGPDAAGQGSATRPPTPAEAEAAARAAAVAATGSGVVTGGVPRATSTSAGLAGGAVPSLPTASGAATGSTAGSPSAPASPSSAGRTSGSTPATVPPAPAATATTPTPVVTGGAGRDVDNLVYGLSTVDQRFDGMGGDDPVRGALADLQRGALAITRSAFDGLNAVGVVSDQQLVVARCVFGVVDGAISDMVSGSFDDAAARYDLATCISALGPQDALLRSQLLDAIGSGQVAAPQAPSGGGSSPVVNPAPVTPDPTPFPSTSATTVAPAQGTFTSGFGSRWGSFHYGIDIANAIGTPIRAAQAGTVINAGPADGFGLWVRIRHDDGTITVYGHNDRNLVSVGQRVTVGQQIATIGNRGDSTGPHLHFEVINPAGIKVDPQPWLAARGVYVG
ncbi:M23 family metallopeptidase [Rhodococcus aerolatus]